MRIFLLPISTRRTLLYAQRVNAATASQKAKQSLLERIQEKAAKTWAGWEQKQSGWQKTVVGYGNEALKRIPYEEWALKSVPPLSTKRKDDELRGDDKVEVVYPRKLVSADKVTEVLHALSTEREALHRRRLIWCFVGMPISAPFALVPIVPNIPFFYLVYRAWSHWRALAGGKHIQFLLQNKLLIHTPSPKLDEVYSEQEPPLPSTPETTTTPGEPKNKNPALPKNAQPEGGETMLLSQANGKIMTQALVLPQLEIELERAIWQVETAIEKQNAERSTSKKDDPKSQ
ncbi:mitochondrial K+-H+ exchange-related-domain-containing protein [Diaporthe sp. PMI_573]|nr:mitochondrial K+-H+ exchange-related-domain-containing protein [Diaporthaceae sp. PMI_573]